jgi:large conductance mechanosensitive channel
LKNKLKKIKDNGLIADFRKFINRGNVVDMAVGIIIGSAFSKIVTSLVSDIVMPFLALVTGKIKLSDASMVLRNPELNEAGEVITDGVFLNYGQFIQYIIDFFVVSLCIFIFIRLFSKFREIEERRAKAREEAKEQEPPAPPPPSKEELLLTEIRDLLKEKTK